MRFAAPFATAAEKIRVVTTIPDLADMTRRIAGELVDVTSLATGVEDIHAVPMKPSFALLLNRADVLAFIILALLLLALIALIADTYDTLGWVHSFEWLGAAYLLSRGIAKASRVLEH